MRIALFLLMLVACLGCRTPPPSFVPVPKPPEMPEAPLPEPITPVLTPQSVTPAVAEVPSPVEPLLVALAAQNTATMAQYLADDVSMTLAAGDACVGAPVCLEALGKALVGTDVQVLKRIAAQPDVDVVLGLVLVAQQRVPFAMMLLSQNGRVVTIRVYGNTAPWRFVPAPPKTPALPLTHEPVELVRGVPAFAAEAFAQTFDPVSLAKDATGGGQIAEQLLYHDTAGGTETHTALANQAGIRAFQVVFEVHESHLVGAYAAGEWLVVERDAALVQRAPVVPVPPTNEFLRARTLEVLWVQGKQIVQAWGYADPVAFLPAVEQPAIPAIR